MVPDAAPVARGGDTAVGIGMTSPAPRASNPEQTSAPAAASVGQPPFVEPLPKPRAAAFPRPALAHLLRAAAVLALASLIPYAHEGLADHRYWDRLDASALLRAVTFTPPPSADAVLAAGLPPGDGEELAAADLDALAGVARPGGPGTAADPSVPPAVLPAESATAAVAAATPEALVVDPAALGPQKVWIEGAPGVLAPFHRALGDLALGRKSHVRIAHYGDSHTANDGITHVTRQLLQRRFGDGGHGFSLVQGRTQWYAHKGVTRSASATWRVVNFLSGNARDGAYGYGGVAAEGGPGSSFTLGTGPKHVGSRFLLFYRSQGAATVSARLGRTPLQPLVITEPADTDAMREWQVPEASQGVAWRVTAGRVRLFGGAVERERGIVYDSLGEVGARGPRWLQADAAHLKRQMELRPPDLLIVNYGGNEATDRVSEANYLARMQQVLSRLRAGHPGGACLVIGPGDHGKRRGGKVISDPDVVRINDWQRKLAGLGGCGFFDARGFMGGEGSMGRWFEQGLGWADFSHFTARGEQAMGLALYRAILKDLQQFRGGVAQGPK